MKKKKLTQWIEKKGTSAAGFPQRHGHETNRVGEKRQDKSVISFRIRAPMFSSFLTPYLN